MTCASSFLGAQALRVLAAGLAGAVALTSVSEAASVTARVVRAPAGNGFPVGRSGPSASGLDRALQARLRLPGMLPTALTVSAFDNPARLELPAAVPSVSRIPAPLEVLPRQMSLDLTVDAAAPTEDAAPVSVPELAEPLAPHIAAASDLEKASVEDAAGTGRTIEALMLRRPTVPEDASRDVLAPVRAPWRASLAPAPNPTPEGEALLRDLRAKPPQAVIFDYDGTLTDNGPDGVSLPAPKAVIAGLEALLAVGVPVGIATARVFDQPGRGAPFPVESWETIVSKISPSLRRNLFFSGALAGELVEFDAAGAAVWKRRGQPWSEAETLAIARAVETARNAAGLASAGVTVAVLDGQVIVDLPRADDRSGVFSKALGSALAAEGLPYPAKGKGRIVQFGRELKSDGARGLLEAMGARGFTVSEEGLLVVGDHFERPTGVDAEMAEAFPRARAADVGGKPAVDAPPNAVRIGVEGSAGSLMVMAAVEDGLAVPAVPPADRGPAGPAGMLARITSRLGGLASFFRVLPDAERNREYWKFVIGQALSATGVAFHYTALPTLVAQTKEDSWKLGANRAVNWGSQAAANLSTGPMLDRTSVRRVLSLTLLARSALLFLIPVLFFNGALGFLPFLAITFAMGFLQSMTISAGSVAQLRIMAGNEAEYNRANAVYNLVTNVVGVVAPLLAGSFIGLMDARFGLLAGNALAYAVYGGLALVVALAWALLRTSNEPVMESRKRLAVELASEVSGRTRARAVYVERDGAKPGLLVEVDGDPTVATGLPREFEGFAVRAIPKRHPLREFAEGMRLIWSHRFLRLAMLFPTLYLIAADSLVFTALPRYIRDIADLTVPGFLAGVPFLGAALSALSTKAGAMGLYLAASSLGVGLSALVLLRRSKSRAEDTKGRLTHLERQGVWSSILHGVGALAYWGVFFSAGLWGSVGSMFLVMLLQGPAWIVWASLSQKALQESFPEHMGKMYSAMFFYQLACSILGVLFFGWLMQAVATTTALWIVGLVMTGAAILDFIEPYVALPVNRTSDRERSR